MLLRSLFVLLPCLAAFAGDPVVIDGQFAEWSDVPVALTDPADAPNAFVDIGEVRISHDSSFVHMFVDLGKSVCVQQLDGMLLMILDVDGKADTGSEVHGLAGTDIIITLSPESQFRGRDVHMGVGIASLTYVPSPDNPEEVPLNPYDVGFTFGPTYASSKFEFRIRRNIALPATPATFTGDSLRVKLVATDFAGNVLDETDTMEHALVVAPAPADATPPVDASGVDPMAKADNAQLRVVSFNGEYSKILDDADRLGRVLRAIKPDIILFQELTNKTEASDVESTLNRQAPPPVDRWRVRIGQGGGNLRCGIATYLPISPVEKLELVSFPDNPDRELRQDSALIEHNGRRLLAVSIHLRCCGGPTGPEEESRMTEVTELRKTIDPLREALKIDGFLAGGDFNLVGTRNPLDTFCKAGDFDGTDLTFAQPYKLDNKSNATWSDRTQPFVPGRLDYIVTSDSSLVTVKSFVFDTADLASTWLEHYELRTDDSMMLSDHRPVVIDLAWKVDVPIRKEETPKPASGAALEPVGAGR